MIIAVVVKTCLRIALFLGAVSALNDGLANRGHYLVVSELKEKQPNLFVQWYLYDLIKPVARLKGLETRLDDYVTTRIIKDYALPRLTSGCECIINEIEEIILGRYNEKYPIWELGQVDALRAFGKLKECGSVYNSSFSQYTLNEALSLTSNRSQFYPREEFLATDPNVLTFLDRYPKASYRGSTLIQVKKAMDEGFLLERFDDLIVGNNCVFKDGHIPFWLSSVGQLLIELYSKYNESVFGMRYPYELQLLIANDRVLQQRIVRACENGSHDYVFALLLYFPEKIGLVDKIKNSTFDYMSFLTDRLSPWRRKLMGMLKWDNFPWLPFMLKVLNTNLDLRYKEDFIFDLMSKEFNFVMKFRDWHKFGVRYAVEKWEGERLEVIYAHFMKNGMIPQAENIPNELNTNFESQLRGLIENDPKKYIVDPSNSWMLQRVIEVLGISPISRVLYCKGFSVEHYSSQQLELLFKNLDAELSDYFKVGINLSFKYKKEGTDKWECFIRNLKKYQALLISNTEPKVFYPAIVKKLQAVQNWETYFMLINCLEGILLDKIIGDELPKHDKKQIMYMIDAIRKSNDINQIRQYFSNWSENMEDWRMNLNKLYGCLNPHEIICKFELGRTKVGLNQYHPTLGSAEPFNSLRHTLIHFNFTNDLFADMREAHNLYSKYLEAILREDGSQ